MLMLYIGAAGFAGAIARFWLGGAIKKAAKSPFPWATFCLNISGAFLLGLLVRLGTDRGLLPAAWVTVIGTGFLGAYTTFSTMTLETTQLIRTRKYLLAGADLLLSTMVGLMAAGVGMRAGLYL